MAGQESRGKRFADTGPKRNDVTVAVRAVLFDLGISAFRRRGPVAHLVFAAYPEMEGNVANVNLLLEIAPGANLGPQIKAFKISDLRCAPRPGRA
jgi:hypothetical protein